MKVKIGFMEGAEEWQIKVFLYRFRNIDPSILEFEIDKNNADFLIAFPWLYRSTKETFLQFLQESVGKITIMDVLGEAIAPNLNLFDYHIGFDPSGQDGRVLEAPYIFSYRVLLDSRSPENLSGVLARKKRLLQLYLFPWGGASVPHPVILPPFRLQESQCHRQAFE